MRHSRIEVFIGGQLLCYLDDEAEYTAAHEAELLREAFDTISRTSAEFICLQRGRARVTVTRTALR